jgi:hypothetical protein
VSKHNHYEDKDGKVWEGSKTDPKPGLIKYIKWAKMRVPYKEVWITVCMLDGICSGVIPGAYAEGLIKEDVGVVGEGGEVVKGDSGEAGEESVTNEGSQKALWIG